MPPHPWPPIAPPSHPAATAAAAAIAAAAAKNSLEAQLGEEPPVLAGLELLLEKLLGLLQLVMGIQNHGDGMVRFGTEAIGGPWKRHHGRHMMPLGRG